MPPYGPPLGHHPGADTRTPTVHHPPARPIAHHEHNSLCAASRVCAMPSGTQHELAVSPSKQKSTTRGPACDVGQNIATSPKQAASVVPADFSLSFSLVHKYTNPQDSSAVRLSEPCAPASSRSWSLATRTAKYSPPPPGDEPCQPVTPHVFARRLKLFAPRTRSCHHHGPAAIWPIVLIARHLRLAEISLCLLWCPILPVAVAVDDHLPGRGRLPPARVATAPPPELPQRPCGPDATPPRRGYTSSQMIMMRLARRRGRDQCCSG